jgi:predicted nuclease of predicted toxin-antitoxin system
MGIIRLVEVSARQQGAVCTRLLEHYASELAAHAIVTATSARVRDRD